MPPKAMHRKAMLHNVFTKTLHDQRKMFGWWSLGIFGVSLVYVAGYKQYADAGILDAELPEYLSALMGAMDYASPEGYLNSTFFTLIGSLLTAIFALTIGSQAIAGEEESGMLDILLAHPLTRTRFVMQRFAALVVGMVAFGFMAWVGVSIASRIADMDIALANIAAACTGLTLLGVVIGAVALALGAFTGRRGLTTGVTAGVALVAFLANNLAPMLEWLDLPRRFSPFYYYLGMDPLRTGFDWAGFGVLAGVAIGLAVLAVWGLNRRDVGI
jgi:ABC-2 type transport system permease protein